MSAAEPPQGAKAPSGGSAACEAASMGACYIGRFAPSPTGPLHAGSLVAALASWLDARAHGGQWLVRMEDVDTPRCAQGAHLEILRQLAACGLLPDAPPTYQSQRSLLYQAALQQLDQAHAVYPCVCSRSDIQTACQALGQQVTRHGEWVYPGTCRTGLVPSTANSVNSALSIHTPNTRVSGVQRIAGSARQPAYRFKVLNDKNTHFPDVDINKYATNSIVNTVHIVNWQDRRLGCQQQNVANDVGDFVLRRTDALWAYQLAVVVDDAQQGVTHIVRGEDLADNTARQILLQRALGYSTPHYLHTPLVLAQDGYKLSKQNGAAPLDTRHPAHCLRQAATVLGLNEKNVSDNCLLTSLVAQWPVRYPKA